MGGRPLIAKLAQSALCGLFAAALALADIVAPAQAEPTQRTAGTALFVASPLPRAQGRHHKRRLKRDTDHDGLANWVEVRRTKTNPRRRDTDRDGLSDWTEVRRSKTNPRRRDTDRDGLSDWTEVRRSKTNPRRRDTDRDGLTDGRERKRTKTNPRKADSDGDGFRDRWEIRAGSNPRNPASIPIAPAAVPVVPPAAPAPAPGPGQDQPPSTPESPEEEPSPPPDTTPPQTTITSSPPALTASSSALFSFAASESGSSFECRLNAAAFGACPSPKQYAGLNDGSHNFSVRAIDQAGNRDPSPASYEWTVDTVPPTVQIDSGPDGLTNDASPTFGFSAEPGARLECSIDQGAPDFGPCSAPGSHTPAEPLADGEYTFRVRASDAATNQATATRSFEVDTAAPSAPELTATEPPSPANDNTPEVLGSAPAGTTVRLFDGGDCGGAPIATVTPAELEAGVEATVTDDSITSFRATATTAAENTSGCSEALLYVEDSTAPETQIDSGPAALTNSASATLSFSGDDGGGSGVAFFQCRRDSEDPEVWTSCASPQQYTSLADGAHSFEVRTIDEAGNVDSSPASQEWTVDTTPPAVQIDSGPDGLTNDSTPTFAFSSEPGAALECSIDEGTPDFGPCSSPESHTHEEPLADGAYTFRVRATDAADNQATAVRDFTVDTAAPSTAIDTHPPALISSAAAEFGFSGFDPGGSGVASFECRIDSSEAADWQACTSPKQYGELSDSPHEFAVRAVDNAGNVDPEPASHEWTVDTVPPALQIDSGPDGLTNNASPTFAFSSEPGAGFECSIDQGTPDFGPCSDTGSHTPEAPLADGEYTFRVRATDAAANQAVTTRGFEVDATAPETEITAKPPVLVNTDEASFEFGGEDPGGSGVASFECRIDSADPEAWTSCTSPQQYASLPDGAHSFEVRAIDEAGNVDASPASHEWTVDTTPPAVQIDSGPDGLTNDSTPTFAFSSEPKAALECSIDQGTPDFGPCAGPDSHTPAEPLTDGEHTFRVRATDAASNQATATRDFTVDTAAPGAPELTATVPASPANHNTPQIAGTAPAGTTVHLYAGPDCGGAPIATVTAAELEAGVEATVADDSTTTFRATATTAAENTSGCSEPLSYVEDSTAPETQIDSGPAALVNSASATFSFSGNDGGGSGIGSFQCRIDSSEAADWQACTSSKQYAELAEGNHEFEVRAIDDAGNVDGSPASHEWQIDTTPPAVSVDSGPEGLANNASPAFGFSSEPGAGLECSIDQGTPSFGPCSEAESHTPAEPLADGEYTFRVRATDAATNEAVATRSFTVDATPPDTQITAKPAALVNSDEATFEFSGDDGGGSGIGSFECKLDAASFSACSSGIELSELSEGSHTFEVRAIDQAGNVDDSAASHEWTADTVAPTTQIDAGPASPVSSATATFSFSGADPEGSGVASFECKLDEAGFAPCTSGIELSELAEGSHRFEVRAIDEAGNVDGSAASHEWTVDLTAPQVTIDSLSESLLKAGQSSEVEWHADEEGGFELRVGGADCGSGAVVESGAYANQPEPHLSSVSAAQLAEGANTLRLCLTDAAGNRGESTASLSKDTKDPATQITAKPATPTNSDEAQLAFSGSDPGGSGVASFECRRDSEGPEAWTACGSPQQYSELSDGSHIFEVRAIDVAGNADQSPAGFEWTVDTTPPGVQIDSGPDGLTNDASPTFGFSFEPGATVQCSIDQGAPDFGPCSDPESHTPAEPLADGEYTFRVRASDAATNQATATRSFEVDTAAPSAPELTATEPPSPANDNTPQVLGTAPAGTTVRLFDGGDCGGAPIATVTPAELEAGVEATVTDDSITSFRATATTAAENASGCSEALLYVEDSTPPETTIETGPPARTNSATAEFEFSGDDASGSGVASFQCRIDSSQAADWQACTSSRQYAELAEGSHSFEVRAIDNAGNVDPTPASHEWTVDTAAPQVTIDSLSKALLKAGEASEVEWHADENGGFELRIGGTDCDSGAVIGSGAYAEQPEPHHSSVAATQLAEGPNTLRLCLSDAAGNRGETTASLSKDTDAPDTQIDSQPPLFTTASTAEFTFSGDDGAGSGVASFECRRDGGAWAGCASPRKYAELAEGPHEFEVKAVDGAGNRDPIPASFNWTVDTTPPAAQIDSGPDGLTNDPTPTFAFSSEPGASFECSIDNGAPAFGPCSDPGSHTPEAALSEGPHTFRVRASDAAGNQATATRSFEVDTTAPDAPELTATVPASPANQNNPRIFGGALAGTTVDLYSGGDCTGPPVATVSAAALEAGIEVTVPDDSATVFRATVTTPERTSGCAEPLLYVEDSTPPETTIASSPPPTAYSTSASFFFEANEPGASFECKLDGAAFAACGSPKSFAGLSPGGHSFSVRATDAAGNQQLVQTDRSWTIESPPSPAPSACAEGGAEAVTASAVRSAVQNGEDVCVTANVGDVDLSDLGSRPVVVSTEGGSIEDVDLASTTDLTISRARLRAVELRSSHRTHLLDNTIGGTQASRVADQLIFMPVDNDDVTIEGNDIGWTLADDSGNTGYGCRCYGDLDRLRFVGNRLHDLAADGFQGVGGTDVLIDRNEIGPVGRNPESDEHSDNIQITGNETNLRITNNWIHHQGYFEGGVTANSGSTYIHGGSTGSLVYENNLIETAQGRTEICGLGTGGEERSNLTIRRNTWVEGGLAFNGFPGFEWDCDSGSGNVVERNIAVDADGGIEMTSGSAGAASFSANLWGEPSLVALDAAGNCTSANCNPAGEEAIGYRKPSGVDW